MYIIIIYMKEDFELFNQWCETYLRTVYVSALMFAEHESKMNIVDEV